MSKTSFEILIIGGGVTGSSIAYHLARQGRKVLVIERSGVVVEPAASWASAGGVRRQGRHPAEAKLAIEAIERWSTLEQELEADLHYRRGGNLMLAETEAEAEHLVKFVQHQHELGFAGVRLVDRHEAHILVPGLNDRITAGSHDPIGGQVVRSGLAVRPGGHAVYVIANNVIRGERVRAHAILIELARRIGFELIESKPRRIANDRRRFPVGPFGFDGPMTHEHRIVFLKPVRQTTMKRG